MIKIDDKKYTRVEYLLSENDLIENKILNEIEKDVIRLHEQIRGAKKYEGEEILTTLSIVKSHLNKSEAITTTQIEGLNINDRVLLLN